MTALPDYEPEISLSGDGPPLVLVPGMDGTGRLFYRQVPLLATRYRVATYRLRDDAPAMDTLVDDLAQVIAAITPSREPAVVVGESFGGTVALSLALERPELVAALVIINSFPRFLPQIRLHTAIFALRLVPGKRCRSCAASRRSACTRSTRIAPKSAGSWSSPPERRAKAISHASRS